MKKTFLFIVLIGIMLGIGIWIFKTNNDSLNYQAQRSSTNKNNLDEIDIKSTQSTTDTQQVTEQTEKDLLEQAKKIQETANKKARELKEKAKELNINYKVKKVLFNSIAKQKIKINTRAYLKCLINENYEMIELEDCPR